MLTGHTMRILDAGLKLRRGSVFVSQGKRNQETVAGRKQGRCVYAAARRPSVGPYQRRISFYSPSSLPSSQFFLHFSYVVSPKETLCFMFLC